MANSTKDSREKVSLEELLRFKRAERPDEAFWDKFDSELHQRMMQTLVKKDPWPVQLLRGLSGKIAQTTAIAAAAAVLALMVVRPAFVVSDYSPQPPLAEVSIEAPVVAVEEAVSGIDSSLLAEADYEIDVLSVDATIEGAAVTQDFGLDHIEVASYDKSAYSADSALAGFASTGVASLVY